ncbi:hypothetical protein ACHQM5_011243 [Ranunculus cassubicifolius]
MGLFGSAFCLMIGGGAGVYAAQNYDVPNVKKLANDVMVKADNYMEKRFPKTNLPTGIYHT